MFKKITSLALRPAVSRMSRGRLPQTSGRVYAEGLEQEVLVDRDRWAIPHIRAASRHDLFFAQGYVHAQDRLWQMELNRRAATGRLAEVLGAAALDTDRLTRTLGFGRLASQTWNRTSETVRADVLAYTAGVNAFLAADPALPVEFSLLRYEPEPWDPLHSLAFARMLAWSLSHGWAGELTRARLVEQLGAVRAAELEPRYPERNPVTLPEGIEFNVLHEDGMLRAAAGPFLARGMEGGGRGSNAWVVSGTRSATGRPILCCDLHLPVTTPSLWYFNHLRSVGNGRDEKSLHVAGVSQAGVPYVLVGHNEHIAWGATLSFVDSEDLFVERFDRVDPRRYEFQGEWREAEIFDELILVKGQHDHVERVTISHHGPIISRVVPGDGRTLALNAVALQPVESFDGFARLNSATNWDEFVDAVKKIESPSLNLVYADTSDNIGYYVSGKVPIRSGGQGLVPSPGWTGDYEWIDHVPFEEMPHTLNPSEGFLVTANQRIVGDDYPYYLGSSWMNGYRARRIHQLIRERSKVSVEDCQHFHMDLRSIHGTELIDCLVDLETEDPDALISLELLRSWDGWLGPQSVGGAVYEVLLNSLSTAILEPILGRELSEEFLGAGPHPILLPISEFHGQWSVTLLRLISGDRSSWLTSTSREPHFLIECLAKSTKELRKLLGGDTSKWQWGRLHQLSFEHAFSAQPPLDGIFNQGPFPIGGDTNTVCQVAAAPGRPYGPMALSSSFRQIVEMGDLGASVAMHAPGQSGHLASSHYGDLIEPWLHGDYYTSVWNESDVASASEESLTLAPQLNN